MKLITAALLAASFFLSSCDPMRRINMKNRTGENVTLTWTIREDSIHSSPLFLSNTREVVFELTPGRPGNRINLSCGVGYWTPKAVAALTDDLESLVIRWHGGEIRLDSAAAIGNYLMPRRKGLDRGKIEIVLKD